ncbi:hypothetical protein ACFQ6H_27210 [Rhodococcus sp. NPDC056506]|uniref:DUF7426 family protein n=1 Tax=Rhodococcus sp. NPDC056506 TaxID=3345844 RepID=UPI00366AE48A
MRDLREFYNPDFKLPIGGKEYVIKSPNADEGLRIRMLFADPNMRYTDDDQVAEIAKLMGAVWVPNLVKIPVLDPLYGDPVLGDDGEPVMTEDDWGDYQGGVWSELRDDGITWPEIMHAGTTALIHYGQGAVLAELYWENGMGDMPGNQLPPKPEARPEVPGERSSNPKARKRAKRNNRKRK